MDDEAFMTGSKDDLEPRLVRSGMKPLELLKLRQALVAAGAAIYRCPKGRRIIGVAEAATAHRRRRRMYGVARVG